jgi:tetratricopeptide (TPR) repeat protein
VAAVRGPGDAVPAETPATQRADAGASGEHAPVSRFAIWPKRWFFVVLAVVGLSLCRSVDMPWARSAAVVLIAMILLEQLLRWYTAKKRALFDRELQVLIQGRETDQLLARYSAQLFLRCFAPRHEMRDRLGLIHKQRGDLGAAQAALREAVEEAPPKEAPALAKKLADTLYAAGDHLEAERFYRRSQDEKNNNPGVRARIARMIVARGGDLSEAARLLQEAVEEAQGQRGCGVFRCQLVEVLAGLGQRDEAVWQLQIAEEEIAGGPAEEQECLVAARRALDVATSREQ